MQFRQRHPRAILTGIDATKKGREDTIAPQPSTYAFVHEHVALDNVTYDSTGPRLSIIIPTYNERKNLPELLHRIQVTMAKKTYEYEIIVVDDNSNDGSFDFLRSKQRELPLHIIRQEQREGKAPALIAGIQAAQGQLIAMIDADLQYPPEAIPKMAEKIGAFDIVVANRRERKIKFVRSVLGKIFRTVIGKIVLSLPVDVQSGLKVFRRETLANVSFSRSKWGFDYQYLFQAKRMGWEMGGEDIVFSERKHGTSHVSMLKVGTELVLGALILRLKFFFRSVFSFLSYPHPSEYFYQGFHNEEDYLFLPEIHSVKRQIRPETISLAVVLIAIVIASILGISLLFGTSPFVVMTALGSLLYLCLIFFKVRIVYASTGRKLISFTQKQVESIQPEELPLYTILIPLYQEADVVPQIVEAMGAIDYPTEKLEIIITLEEYDLETRDALLRANLPPHFRLLMLPDVKPKTKPKALNVAFKEAKGEYLVIYDAEIIPDSDQLKKAFLAFQSHTHVDCLQTRLDHYNTYQSWITRLFNAEFTFYYDLFLPGLQKLGYPIPLSGHSTHFRRSVLQRIGAWDPYNVTEDCDVGIRMFRSGFKSDILDSFSKEEATSSIGAWVAQRSRWMKGFVQTAIIHLRHPLRLKKELGGWRNFVSFLIIVPGSVLVNLLNFAYWVLLVGWLTTHSTLIQQLFPGVVLYTSFTSFLVGNFLFTYCNLLGSFKRKRYGLVKYSLLSFVYWILLAYATMRGMAHMLWKPHHWEKTKHGKHLFTSKKYALALST